MNTQLTIEELLAQRFEVIDDYPFNTYPIGTILAAKDNDGIITLSDGRATHATTYPRIFKELGWYEKRELNQLPTFVRDARYPQIKRKVKEWVHGGYGFHSVETGQFAYTKEYTPITEVEYLQQ